MKDGDMVQTSGRISVDDSGTLRIQDTDQDDIGVYVCVAYNVAGEKESIPCQLTVKGKLFYTVLYFHAFTSSTVSWWTVVQWLWHRTSDREVASSISGHSAAG